MPDSDTFLVDWGYGWAALPRTLAHLSQPGLNRGSTASTTKLCLFIISKTITSLSEQVDRLAESPLANALVGLSLCLLVAHRPCLPSRAGDAGCSASKKRLHFPHSMSVIRHVA